MVVAGLGMVRLSTLVGLGRNDALRSAKGRCCWSRRDVRGCSAHPEFFHRDPVLANPHNSHFYATIHLPLVQFIGSTVGSYGTAFLLLLPLSAGSSSPDSTVFGRTLLRSRTWALLLAIVTAVTIELPAGRSGAFGRTRSPRVTFQALLPFVLAAAWRWRAAPRAWPWVMVAAGLLTYVHPVSAPVWGLALWLGFWPFLPRGWSWRRRVVVVLLLGAVFLAVAGPFAASTCLV